MVDMPNPCDECETMKGCFDGQKGEARCDMNIVYKLTQEANTKLEENSNHWFDLDEILEIIKDPKWQWILNPDCKYINLRIDMRDKHCILMDRNNNVIHPDHLRIQYGRSRDTTFSKKNKE